MPANNLKKFYCWLWAGLALALSFGTRYIVRLGLREYDTISFYGVDIIFLLLLAVSIFLEKKNWRLAAGWGAMLGFFIAIGLPAPWYWWLRLFEAATVVYLLYQKNEVKLYTFGGLMIGMTVSSFFGIAQLLTQRVEANKWLGMAAQFPWQAGVAVLESNAGRLLRAYATFPYPNIFGGLAALSLLLLFSFENQIPGWWRFKRIKIGLIAVLMLGLCTSFSRSAWLALAVGLVWLGIRRKISWRLVGAIVAFGIIFNTAFYPFTIGRVLMNNRLEMKSIDDRAISAKTSLAIIKAHPLLGVGLGNFTGSAAILETDRDPRFVEPVHNVYLLIMAELGLVGALLFIMLARLIIPRLAPWSYPLLLSLLVLGLFDHYWWTLVLPRLLAAILLGLALQNKISHKLV